MKYLGPPQSGSQANQTASRNPHGQYYRDRTIPVQPDTPAQISSRGLFAAAVNDWSTLTDIERLAWSEWARTVPTAGVLRDGFSLTGQTGFVGAHMVAAEHGLGFPGGVPPEPATWTLSRATVTLTALSVVCAWTAAAGARIGLYLTMPTRATRAYSSARRPKLLFTSTAAGSEDLTLNYVSFFGGLPLSGQSVYLLAREVSGLRLSPGIVARAVMP